MLPHLMDSDLPEEIKKLKNLKDLPKNEPIYVQISHPGHGGLGDTLLFSTLPEELYKQYDFKKIYIVTPSSGYYNKEIPNLIWNKNPYISGSVNYGQNNNFNTFNIKYIDNYLSQAILRHYGNNIKAVEALNGLMPKNTHPKIYHNPEFKEKFANKIYVDTRSYSTNFSSQVLEIFIKYCARAYNFNYEDVIIINSKNSGPNSQLNMPNNPSYVLKNLEEYCDLIYSCKMFLTVQSGAAALASAIKGDNIYPKVVSLICTPSYNSKVWYWNNLDYICTGKFFDDFMDK
jgi:hypothetical protein